MEWRIPEYSQEVTAGRSRPSQHTQLESIVDLYRAHIRVNLMPKEIMAGSL